MTEARFRRICFLVFWLAYTLVAHLMFYRDTPFRNLLEYFDGRQHVHYYPWAEVLVRTDHEPRETEPT